MSFNPFWPKWILAAVNRNVAAVKGSYVVFYEQQPRDVDLGAAWFEVRTNGPVIFEPAKDQFRLSIDVNVLVSCNVDQDLYHIDKMIGDAVAFMPPTLTVVDDSATFVGCLVQKNQNNQTIRTTKYGQVDKVTRLLKAKLDSHYLIDLP